MLILVLLGIYFDAAVVFVTSQTLFFKIGSGHTVHQASFYTMSFRLARTVQLQGHLYINNLGGNKLIWWVLSAPHPYFLFKYRN